MPKPCIVLAPTARCVTCTLPVLTLVTCNTKTCRFKINFDLSISKLVISSGSIPSFVNIFAIPTIQRHAITSKTFGKAEEIKYIFRRARCACQSIMTSLAKRFKAPQTDSFYCGTWKICHHGREFNLWWYSPLQNTTAHLLLNLHVVLDKRKPYRPFLAAPDMISNFNSSAIVTSSICEPLAIVTSRWSIILTLYLWTLSSSQWRCPPGRFSMAAHRHDRRGIYRCALLRFRGKIEIDHSYGLRCRGLCCHSRHSTRAVPGVSAQTTPAQTVSWSIPITKHTPAGANTAIPYSHQ